MKRRKRRKKSGTRCGKVHRAGAWGPYLLDQTRDRRHGLRRGRRTADDEVDRPSIYPGMLEGFLRRLNGERRGVLFSDEVASFDPGSRRDPFVRGVKHAFRSLLVTIPPSPSTPRILPTAPPFKPTCPQTDRRLCAESAAAVPRSGRRRRARCQ